MHNSLSDDLFFFSPSAIVVVVVIVMQTTSVHLFLFIYFLTISHKIMI